MAFTQPRLRLRLNSKNGLESPLREERKLMGSGFHIKTQILRRFQVTSFRLQSLHFIPWREHESVGLGHVIGFSCNR